MAFFFFYGGVEAIEISETCGDIFADLLHRGIKFRLAAPGDEDVRALVDEALSRGETNPAVTAGYNCYFSVELTHGFPLSRAPPSSHHEI